MDKRKNLPFSKDSYYIDRNHPLRIIKHFFFDIKCCYQRIVYGWCDKDVWAIDWWFLRVIPDMLEQLRKTTHGFPAEIDGKSEEDKAQKWDRILREMAFLFKEADEETCGMKNPYEKAYHKTLKKCKNILNIHKNPKYSKIAKKYNDFMLRIDKYREKCLNDGMELFTKWFWHLWD